MAAEYSSDAQYSEYSGRVAELADALASGASESNLIRVQLPSRPPTAKDLLYYQVWAKNSDQDTELYACLSRIPSGVLP